MHAVLVRRNVLPVLLPVLWGTGSWGAEQLMRC
jgi:hypothetical protein